MPIPVLPNDNPLRKLLLERLKVIVPEFTYEFDHSNYPRFTVHIIRNNVSEWSKEYPIRLPEDRHDLEVDQYLWILTIEDFLINEIARVSRY